MLTARESTLLLDLNQRLRDLYVRKAEAQNRQDQACIDALQAEIDELTENCDKVLELHRSDLRSRGRLTRRSRRPAPASFAGC